MWGHVLCGDLSASTPRLYRGCHSVPDRLPRVSREAKLLESSTAAGDVPGVGLAAPAVITTARVSAQLIALAGPVRRLHSVRASHRPVIPDTIGGFSPSNRTQ